MTEMKTLNGFEIVDAQARTDIKNLSDTTKQSLAEIEVAIPSLEGYATEQYVDNAVANIDIPEVNLSNYYTKAETDDAIYTSKDSFYLDFTNATTNAQDATPDMIAFLNAMMANKNVCAHIRDTSTNTARYRPAAVEWSDEAKLVKLIQSDLIIGKVNSGEAVDYQQYIIQYVPFTGRYSYKKEFNTITVTLATQDYVNDAIEQLSIGDIDLTNYYTKSEVQALLPTVPTNISAFTNDAGYTTLSAIKQQGFLTQDSLNNYYTKTEVDNALSNIPDPDLSLYALKTEIPTDDHINTLINNALGVIENGTY